MKSLLKTRLSFITVLFLVIVATYTTFNLSFWNKDGRIINHDVVGYYSYLPALFVYGDITLKKPNSNYAKYKHKFWLSKNNNKGNKFTMGMSMVYLPFFGMAHISAVVFNYQQSGYSVPYRFFLALSSLAYFLLGLLFLRKFLLKHCSEKTTAITILLIGLGSNLFYYVTIGIGMPHLYLFGLSAVLLFYSEKWFNNPSVPLTILIGVISGLVVLIRPTMAILIFGLFWWGVHNMSSLKDRLQFFASNPKLMVLFTICFFILFIPQIIYWKLATGSYISYSYGDEGFFFSDPKLLKCLLGFRKGWLLYTPIMAVSIIGCLIMVYKKSKYAFSCCLILLLYFYTTSSWWTWWFGGSYGLRPMIDVYAILALPMGVAIKRISEIRLKKIRTSIYIACTLLVIYNLFQIRQSHEGLLHHDGMNRKAYWAIFLKLKPHITPEEVPISPPDYNKAKKGLRDQ